jgi:hypothetical protein
LLHAEVAFACGEGLGKVSRDERRGEAGPRVEVAVLDGSEESGGERAESTGVEERGEILLCFGVSNGTICSIPRRGARHWVGRWWWEYQLWGQRNVPKAIFVVAFSNDDNVAVFVYFDVLFRKKGNTIVVAELTN